jgi:hypothetical protein
LKELNVIYFYIDFVKIGKKNKYVPKPEKKLNLDDSYEIEHTNSNTKTGKIETFGMNSFYNGEMIDIYKRVIDVRKLEMIYFKDRLSSTQGSFDLFMHTSFNKYKPRE